MRKSSLFFMLCLLVFFQINAQKTQEQEIKTETTKAEIWADSILQSLSITDKINQLLVLEVDAKAVRKIDFPNAFGGMIINSEGPVGFGKTATFVQKQLLQPALVFVPLSDQTGIDIDSVAQFASPMIMSAVAEPYLLYETGNALAAQAQLLGINGLISAEEELFVGERNKDSWRFAELNQGLHDGGLLPTDEIHFSDFGVLDISSILKSTKPEMILINPDSIPAFHDFIRQAIADDKVDLETLYAKSRQILELKFGLGIPMKKSLSQNDMYKQLNQAQFVLLQNELSAASLTILKNDQELLPIRQLANVRFASLTIGKQYNPIFEQALNVYTQFDHYCLPESAGVDDFKKLTEQIQAYDVLIIALYFPDNHNADFFQSLDFSTFISELNETIKTVVVCFGDPINMEKAPFLLNSKTLAAAYEDNVFSNKQIPQMIFGGIDALGVLPIYLNPEFPKGYGLNTDKLGRFGYLLPAEVGLDGEVLTRIDSIAKNAIKAKAMPGCQILVAKDNMVVFNKSYGYHTYDSLQKVADDDLYDLASLTKVSGAIPALMKLYEEGKFDLDAPLGTYLKYYKRGNKKDITYREILAHQSGLAAYIVYWKTAIKKNGKYRRKTMDIAQSENYPYEIVPGIYLHKDYKEKIYKQIKKSEVGEKKYLYSGLTFFLFPEIIEKLSGESYTDYIYNNFYKPMGATTLTYNPLDKFDIDRIVPTEYDSLFRKSLIQGKVHDEGAAMMGGISCNAGLFSDANDLAKLFQMYCNYGTYGGQRYLKEETVKEFARCQYPENDNRRALGFDRPLPVPHANGNTAVSASQLSFGHTGFTGTFAWADPKYNIVYIFLSNRVYPTRENTKLYDMNVRTNIQQVIYDAIEMPQDIE